MRGSVTIKEGQQAIWKYNATDYGTERELVVTTPEGALVGACDPFWPNGVPVRPQDREHAILVRVYKMAHEYYAAIKDFVVCGDCGARISNEPGQIHECPFFKR